MNNVQCVNWRRWAGGLAIVLAALSMGAGPATAPATLPALSPGDLALLHRLESGTWHDRIAAQAELAAKGFEQEPVARAMLTRTTSPEAQVRLDAVLAKWATEKLLGPSLITMHLTHASAKQAYTELFRQAGATFVAQPENLFDSVAPVSIDADRQPFWAVVQKLEQQTNLGFDRGLDGVLRVMRGSLIVAGPQVIDGQFLIVVCDAREMAPPINSGKGKSVMVQLAVYPEPKTYVMAVPLTIKIDRATDNLGNVLHGATPATAGMLPSMVEQSRYAVYLQPAPKNPGDTLVDFRGMLSLHVACQVQPLDIDDIMHATPKVIDAGGMTMKFLQCIKVGPAYQVSMECATNRSDFNELMQDPRTRVQLFDTRGRKMNNTGMGVGLQGQVYSLNYTFTDQNPGNPGGPPPIAKRLVWNLPSDIRTVDLPIDFKDMHLKIQGK